MSNHEDRAVLRSVKGRDALRQVVAVIASSDDLARAVRLRMLPDYFELRLDCFASRAADLHRTIPRLRAALIMTARHPAEGGFGNLSSAQRCDLLLNFLPHAAFIDIELRSCDRLQAVLETARARDVGRIISLHDLQRTPSVPDLRKHAAVARSLGATVFKVATRTDHMDELERLVAFFGEAKGSTALSAMGIGKLGRLSRRLLAHHGSVLNYAHLGASAVEGQLSLPEMRRVIRSAAKQLVPANSRPKI